jgi:hypothetical protein
LTALLEDIDQFYSAMLAFLEHYDMMRWPVHAWPGLLHDTGQDAVRQGAYSAMQTYNV